MANIDNAMESKSWSMRIASPRNLDGYALFVPGGPFPMDGSRGSRAVRMQQLSVFRGLFPLGIIPSYCSSSSSSNHLGPFSLHSLFLDRTFEDGWVALVGKLHPWKLISSIKDELFRIRGLNLSSFRDVAKCFVDKSLYALGLGSHLSLTSSSSLVLNVERHGERNGSQYKAFFYHELPGHCVSMDAGWPELFVDHNGKYWNVPNSVSLNMASIAYKSDFNYHLSVHKNNGEPQPINVENEPAPLALMPGIGVKAAFSYSKNRDLWGSEEKKKDAVMDTEPDSFSQFSYDMRFNEPHASISRVIGGTCSAWVGEGGRTRSSSPSNELFLSPFPGNNTSCSLSADAFASFCGSIQHGFFRKRFNDLTRLDARLDLSSAFGLSKCLSDIVFRRASIRPENSLYSPRLNFILHQQVMGPVVLRVDTKVLADVRGRMGVEDCVVALDYFLQLFGSGKLHAWYSPFRKEGMVEFRLFEF